MSRFVILAVAVALIVALPEAGHACAACFDARAENRFAFLATTAFLSLLPLGMVGGAGLWLRNKARRAEGEDQSPEPPDA